MFRSTNGGEAWTKLEQGFTGNFFSDFFFTILIDPSDPEIVYVGEGGSGVYKSTDGGDSWTPRNNGLPAAYLAIWASAMDPTSPSTLYLGLQTHGVYRSTNSGDNWEPRNEGLTGSRYIGSLLIDPTNASILYAGDIEDGVFKTTDGGGSWIAASDGLPEGAIVRSLAINSSNPQELFLGTEDDGLFKTTDGGGRWESRSGGLDDSSVLSLLTHPAAPGTVFAGTRSGVFVSHDSGDSWTPASNGIENPVIRGFAVDPTSPERLFCGTYMGVFESIDFGVSWRPRLGGFPAPQVFDMVIDPFDSELMYAATHGPGVFKSADAGQTWTALNDGLRYPKIFALDLDESDPSFIVLATESGGVQASTDAGTRWRPLNDGLVTRDNSNSVGSILIHPTSPNRLYAGDRGVVNLSDNRGKWWVGSSNGLPFSFINAVHSSPEDTSYILGGTNSAGVFVTNDDGQTWQESNSGLSGALARHIQEFDQDPSHPAAIFLSTGEGVYKTEDAGSTWVLRSEGLPEGIVRCLAVDPSDPAHLIVAIEDQGVYETYDSGIQWEGLDAPGLTNLSFWSIAISHSDPSRIHVGTSVGVFSLTRTSTIIEDDSKDGPDIPRGVVLSQNYPNPFNPYTTISFTVPSMRSDHGRVRIAVHSIRGDRVRLLLDESMASGTHEVQWDGRDDRGRVVPSGSYLYRITLDGRSIVRKMVALK